MVVVVVVVVGGWAMERSAYRVRVGGCARSSRAWIACLTARAVAPHYLADFWKRACLGEGRMGSITRACGIGFREVMRKKDTAERGIQRRIITSKLVVVRPSACESDGVFIAGDE
jgi:hypothetical protein